MAKRTTPFALMLPQRDVDTPAYRWLYSALRAEILEGRLRPGARLPGTRDLGAQYGLARGTIVSAFDQLKAEGYIEGTVGSGTYVSEVLPDELLQVARVAAPHARQTRRVHRSHHAKRITLFPGYEPRPMRAFRSDLPALDLFPTTLWAQLASRRLKRVTARLLMGCEPMGYRPLREAVADYLVTSRGVNCTADQVAIVSGAQEALDLAARLFLDRGDRVAMEDPGYIGAAHAFESAGARISPIAVDDEGMKVPRTNCRLAYITPGHQFPLGVTMSLARRLAMLDWARKTNALIFEDDYDSEFRYAGRPMPALQGLDRHGLVLFSGTFSKVLFPSLRIGYLVVPPELVPLVDAAKSITTRHAPLLEQTVLCDFIVDGHFGRHLRRMREIYAERLSALLDAARERLAGLIEIPSIEAGLQTVGWLSPGFDADEVKQAAAIRNVEVTPLATYARRRMKREGLQLGFATVDPREIRRGVRELATAMEQLPGRR